MRGILPFLVVLLTAGSLAAAEEGPRRVLLIHSFGRDFSPFAEVAARFRTRLAELSPVPVEFIDAPLEMARFDGGDRDRPLLDFLRSIYRDRPPDLLVPVGAPAGMFANRHRDVLFPDTPVILLSADKRRMESADRGASVTSIGLDMDLAAILSNITDLLPQTEHVHVVGGTSPMEKFWESELRREWSGRGEQIRFHWLTDHPVAEIGEMVRDLPPRSAIVVAIMNRDAAGVPHEAYSALRAIRRTASAPIFGYSEQQLGEGIVGGRLAPMARIAVFDNDGTLWSEQPMYFQAFFVFDRIKQMAPRHPEWKDREPFASVLKGDLKTALALIVHHDDAEREWAYDRESHVDKLAKGLDEARKRGWTLVSMKNDWKTIFP